MPSVRSLGAAFGMVRRRMTWVGANSAAGIATINPVSQSAGGTQLCGAVSLKPQT